METNCHCTILIVCCSSYPTYEEWKQCLLVFIVDYNWVLILPMRNGNLLSHSDDGDIDLCSYPTYEEWKPIQPFVGSPSIICSYPTYEEWKHSKHHIIIFP